MLSNTTVTLPITFAIKCYFGPPMTIFNNNNLSKSSKNIASKALTSIAFVSLLTGLPLSANAGFLDSIRSVQSTIGSIGQTANTIRGSKQAVEDLTEEVGLKGQSSEQSNVMGGKLAAGAVLQGKLNSTTLYSQPNKSSASVATLSRQDIMIYMGSEKNDFYYVQSDKGEGWVSKPLVAFQY